MTGCDEIRLSLGALVLSALDPADERRVREHLAGCPECAAEVAELERTARILALAGPDSYPAVGGEPQPVAEPALLPAGEQEGFPESTVATGPATPSPRVLDGLLAAVAAQRRRDRRRRITVGVAAAAVAAVLAAVGAAAIDDPRPAAPEAAAPETSAPGTSAPIAPDSALHGSENGVVVDVGMWGRGWGAAVHVDLWGVPGGLTCSLVAVGLDGTREVAATWTVPSNGYDPSAGGLAVDGAVGMQTDQVSRFEVVTSAGDVLVTAQT